MKEELKTKCELFIKNRESLKKCFKFESEINYLLGSLLYIQEDKNVDIDKLKETEKIFKENTNVFSDFRGSIWMLIVIKMSLQSNPLEYFNEIKNIYEKINKKSLLGSSYKVFSAILACDNKAEKDVDEIIIKADNVFSLMKKEHPILTADEDIPYTMLLALSEKNEMELIDDMENCYKILNEKFRNKNAVQSLSHILSLSTKNSEEKSNKAIEIYDLLMENERKINPNFELSILGALAEIDKNSNEIVQDIIEVDDYLKSQKGLDNFSIEKSIRLMFASTIVTSALENDSKINTTPIMISLSILIEETILIIIMLTSIIN